MTWYINFADPKSPLEFDFVAFNGAELLESANVSWNGSSWIEYVATYTEGRANDFWVDYTNGIIYFKAQLPQFAETSVRVTYEYGASTVPHDIKKACALMTAIDVAAQSDYIDAFPEGTTGGITVADKIDLWQKQIDEIMREHREVVSGLI